MNALDFYFDFISPYSFLAHKRVCELAEKFGLVLNYYPIDLNAAKLKAGNTGPSTAQIPPKFRYARKDLERWAERYGVKFNYPPRDAMPANALDSSRAHKGVLFARRQRRETEYVTRLWQCTFGSAGWVGDQNAWIHIVEDMGWSREAFFDFVGSQEAESEYMKINIAAQERGVFGVPTMCVDDEMWWGNDRLFFVEEYLSAFLERQALELEARGGYQRTH